MAYENKATEEKHFFYTVRNDGYGRNDARPRFGRIAGALAAGVVSLTMLAGSCTVVPAGHVGVRSMFGSVKSEELRPGFNTKIPLESVIDMTTRTREIKEHMEVPTSEGLITGLDVSVLYHLNPMKADEVYSKLGDDKAYEENVVAPTVRSISRDVVANYKAEDLYSTKREAIGQQMAKQIGDELGKRGIVLEKALIRDLKLPDKLTGAIQDKLGMEQEALKMDYTIQKERKEADRKTIEAKGIADAQHIIAASLNQEYLQWKYIEVLQNTVNSPNNTTVILPFDQKLTPILPISDRK